MEARGWNAARAGIGFGRDLVRLADVDEKVAALGHSLRYLFGRQIVNLPLIRHSNPPSLRQCRTRLLALARQPRPSRGENQAPETGLKTSNRDLRPHLDHPTARNLTIVGRILSGAAEPYVEV